MRGELARLHLGSDIIANIQVYANNLKREIKSPLLREAYIIFLQTNNKKSWCNKTLKSKQFLQESDSVINFTNRKSIKLSIKEMFITTWKAKLIFQRKMRTDVTYKNRFKY